MTATKPIINDIFQVSQQFLGELKLWLSQDPPTIPAASVQGLPNIVTGSVGSAGTADEGAGYTVSHSATGVYVVAFVTGRQFAADANVQVQLAADQAMLAPVLSAVSGTGFTVKVRDATSSLADCPFQFTARPTV